MHSDSLSFAHLDRLWVVAFVVVLSVWATAQHAAFARVLARIGDGPAARRLVGNVSSTKSAWKLGLWSAGLVLLASAVLQPRYGLRETEVSNAGIDIVLAVDASKSMLVKDVVPNRLQGTVLEVSALLQRLHGGRVALVPFAGIPFVQCPLTTDHEVVRTYLADLKPEDVPVGGTNIGRALTLGVEALTGERERAEAELRDNLVPQFKGSKHKAIVLFSDGEDHEGGALEAAQKAAAQGIRVFAVGVGSAFGDPVPILGSDGAATGIQKDEAGNPVFSKLNMELLTQVADATGGKAFRYGNKSVADELFAALDALEKAEYTAQYKQLGEDRFQWLLGPALLLLLGDTVLSARRRRRRNHGGAATAALAPGAVSGRVAAGPTAGARAVAALLAALVATTLPVRPAWAVPGWLLRENPDVADGRERLTQKKYGEALQAFERARASRPEHALLWYNTGVAQAAFGQFEEATTSLARALGTLKDRDRGFEADIHYATGTAQVQWARKLEAETRAAPPPPPPPADDDAVGATPPPAPPVPALATDAVGHWRLAVASLELALLAAPERADVRRNLEFARLAAWPPCRLRDKVHEPNDSPQQAKALPFAADQREQVLDLRSCAEDTDLFAVQLEPGDRFSAKVAAKADAQPQGDPDEASGPARLALRLLAHDGKEQLRGPAPGAAPLDAVDLGRADRREVVLVEVKNPAEVETAYDLTLKLLPACPRVEDRYEPNDAPESAKAITLGEPIKGRLCPVNDDHFAVPLAPGQGLLAAVKPKVEAGSDRVELAILAPDGSEVAHGRVGKEGLLARLPAARAAGTYVVRLRGAIDTEADYELAVQVLPPCSQRDDPFEDNDQAVQANPLATEGLSGPLDGLQLCPGDDDWYAVELKAGESLFLDLAANLEAAPDAADLAGHLTVEVWDSHGTLWSQAVGSAAAAEAGIARTAVVLAPPPGTYRVRVTGGAVAAPTFPLPELPPGSLAQTPRATTVPAPDPTAPGPDPTAPGRPDPKAPAPAPIAHVMLPPGWPAPAVDPAAARLDLQYSLKLRILPPCPAGNDEFEPNDEAKDAKPLEVGQEQLLRLCQGDRDWVAVTQKAGQNLQISARYDLGPGQIELDAFDEAGTASLGKGGLVGSDQKPRPLAASDDTPAARRGRTATAALAVPGGKADRTLKLRVQAAAGVENFYVLRIEEPPPPSDQGQPKPNPDEGKEDDKKDEDAKKNEKKDPEKGEQPQPAPTPEQERRRQQMERNDHNPKNLEALEAMKRSPFRNTMPDKDW
ncbi:MAG: VWA domain-containing protein [Myxococcales bacterium]|nr:VWA domain-containing protein [Myxococcales bacterium]